MRILIIDNAAIVRKDGKHYTNALNGLFLTELSDLGHSLSYIQFSFEKSDSISVFCLEQGEIDCVELPSVGNKVLRYLSSIPKLISAIRESDFIYFYYPNSLYWVTLLCRLSGRPYGLYLRGMNGIYDKKSIRIYKYAYTIFTVSDLFTNMVNTKVGRMIARTIRPMIPFTDDDVVRNRSYKAKDKYRILYLGRLAKDKGLEELVRAAEVLHNKGYEFELHLVGGGEYVNELHEMLNGKSRIHDYLFIDGPIFDNEIIAACYKESDLFILPSYHEGFPRTLYEAMIFGTPLITTFVGGIPAIMKDGVNCKRIESRSVKSIVDVLMFAMNNYEQMGRMASNATELVSGIVDKNRPTHAKQLNQVLSYYGK